MGYIDPRPPSEQSPSSSSTSSNRPPVDPNKRYPNPSFGLSPWGPLVPASDCKVCLYTLTCLQIYGGLLLFWAKPNYPRNRASPQPTQPATAASANTVSSLPQLNQFPTPNTYRASSSSSTASSASYQQPFTRKQIWIRRAIKATNVGLGSFLIFLAGLELFRLQLPYDPWVEDAAKARRAAESRIKRSIGGGTVNNEKVSWWFGPKGYRAVDYKEWKRRVDESLLKSLETRNKYGPNVKPPIPPPFSNTGINAPTTTSSSRSSLGPVEHAMADKILTELRHNNRVKHANMIKELEKYQKIRGTSDDEEGGLPGKSSHNKEGKIINSTIGNINISFSGSNADEEDAHNSNSSNKLGGEKKTGSNKKTINEELKKLEEEIEREEGDDSLQQQQTINSPDDINIFSVMDAWNTLSAQTDVNFRTILHYVDPYTRAGLPNPAFAKKNDDDNNNKTTKEEQEESKDKNQFDDDDDNEKPIAAEIDVEKSKDKTDFKS